jgi:hypothetical protein
MLLSPQLQPASDSAHKSDIVFIDCSTVVFLSRNSHESLPRTPGSDEELLVDIGRRPPKGIALPFIPDDAIPEEDEDEETEIDDTNEVSEKEEVLPGISQGDVLEALGGEFQQRINAMMASNARESRLLARHVHARPELPRIQLTELGPMTISTPTFGVEKRRRSSGDCLYISDSVSKDETSLLDRIDEFDHGKATRPLAARRERDRRRNSSFQTDPEFGDVFPANRTGPRRIRCNSDGVCDPPHSFMDDFDRPGSSVLPRMAMGEGSEGVLFFSDLDERAVMPEAIREFVAVQWESARPRTSRQPPDGVKDEQPPDIEREEETPPDRATEEELGEPRPSDEQLPVVSIREQAEEAAPE